MLLAGALLVGCGSKDPQRAFLDTFLDTYIKHADPAGALQYTTGLALSHLQEEVHAVSGQPRPTAPPDVEYKVVRQTAKGDTTTYELELTLGQEGGGVFTRELIVEVARTAGTFVIVDFVFLR